MTGPRALVFEAAAQPELATLVLRAVRKDPYFDDALAIVAVAVDQVARIVGASGFDDFVLHPYAIEEIYGRLRALTWRRHELEEIETGCAATVTSSDGVASATRHRSWPATA